MTTSERVETWIFWIVSSGLTLTATGVWWIVRTVFTNAEVIRQLQTDLQHRDQLRHEDRDRLAHIEGGLDDVKNMLIVKTQGIEEIKAMLRGTQ